MFNELKQSKIVLLKESKGIKSFIISNWNVHFKVKVGQIAIVTTRSVSSLYKD